MIRALSTGAGTPLLAKEPTYPTMSLCTVRPLLNFMLCVKSTGASTLTTNTTGAL